MSHTGYTIPEVMIYEQKKKKKTDDTPVTEMNTVFTNEMTGRIPANPDDEDYAEDEEFE